MVRRSTLFEVETRAPASLHHGAPAGESRTSGAIYFVAGEASADNHGAALMGALRELDPAIGFAGRGGPKMKAVAGAALEDWIGDAGVMGLWEVVKHYSYFRRKFRETLAEIERLNPAAVLLIDYPGFNLRLARELRRRASQQKIIYYISPQVWAWHRGRIRKMTQWIDLMLCIFPFEADLYNRSGLRTRFVGHPMIDRLARDKMAVERDPNLIGLFPGSREPEVRKIFPVLVKVMQLLRNRRPSLRFEVGAASPELGAVMQTMLHAGGEVLDVQINTGNSAELMQRAAAGVVASGSATLEAAHFRLPFILIYKLAWITYWVACVVVRVPHIGMPNVLAGKAIVPEFIQHRAQPDAIAAAVLSLIEDKDRAAEMVREFDLIMGQLEEGGASERAAREIVLELGATA